jgi:hypothetical protein
VTFWPLTAIVYAAAIARTLHCVASFGVVFIVASTMAASRSAEIRLGRRFVDDLPGPRRCRRSQIVSATTAPWAPRYPTLALGPGWQSFAGAEDDIDAWNNAARGTAMMTEWHQLFSFCITEGKSVCRGLEAGL